MNKSSNILTGDIIKREKQWRKIKSHIMKYKRNIEKKDFEPYVDEVMASGVRINRTIWICWFQGIEYAPTIVRKCAESIEINKPEEFEIIYLSRDNVSDYVKFPEYINEKYRNGGISHAHFSDLLRAELLYLYGGLWIDATVFCAGEIADYMYSGEIFAFRWSLLDNSIGSISSWWMYAVKGQSIISDVRNLLFEYWKYENRLWDYYLFHIIFSVAKERSASNRASFSKMIYANNSDPQVLFGKLEQLFDNKEWDAIRNKMPVQKLSYKKRIMQGDLYNYYTALMEGKLYDTAIY